MEFRPPRDDRHARRRRPRRLVLRSSRSRSSCAALTHDVALGIISLYVVASVFFFMGLLFAYWTYSLGTLRYTLDRNALTITWGDIRQMVPLSQIERLVPGRELPNPHVAGVSWLGHHVGHANVEGGIGDTLFYSTHRSPRGPALRRHAERSRTRSASKTRSRSRRRCRRSSGWARW